MTAAADSPTSTAPVWQRLIAVLAMVLSAALILGLATFELASVDLGYHLAYGREFLDHGSIVERDPFIYATDNHRFVNANWAGQVIFAWIERRGGVVALCLLQIGLVAAIFAALGCAAWRLGARAAGLSLTWLFAGILAYERFSLRPELFSHLLLALLVLLLLGPIRRHRLRIAGAAVLQVAWVNLHSYFLVGPLLTTAFLSGHLLERAWPARVSRPTSLPRHAARWLAIILAVQLAACLVNPRGLDGALFPLRTLEFLREQGVSAGGPGAAPTSPWATISEFHSPLNYVGYSISRRTIDAWLLALVLSVPAAFVALAQRRLAHGAALLLVVLMSFSMRRNIAPMAVVAAPLLVTLLRDVAVTWVNSDVARRRLSAAACLLSIALAAAWLPRVLNGRFYFDERRILRTFGIGWHARAVPVEACRWMDSQADIQPRVFADFYSSSNLLAFIPCKPFVYVDTNTFAYTPEALATAQAICNGAADHVAFFREHGVNIVLLHADDSSLPLARKLTVDPDWALAWYDTAFVIFLRRIPAHAAVIASSRCTPDRLDPDAWIASAERRGVVSGLEIALRAGVPFVLGWYEPAARLFGDAVRREPLFAEAWLNLGVCHAMLANAAIRQRAADALIRERLELAIRCFETVLQIDPDNLAARTNLKRARRSMGLSG